jgi:division protein CdvB (Snf7/Vps24/ESCRT-III family)
MLAEMIASILTVKSYELCLVEKADFTFEEPDGEERIDGLVLLWKIMNNIRPTVVIDLEELEEKLKSATLQNHENDVQVLTLSMEQTYQEIRLSDKQNGYTEKRFLTQLFRALLTAKNPVFLREVESAKMDWIGGDSTITSSVLIERANKWYKTLHKQKVWNKLSDEQTKILNLTTQLANSKNELKELKTQLQAHVTSKGKGNKGGASEGSKSNSNSNPSTNDNKNVNWEEEKKWRCKKQGETLTRNGIKYVWCGEGHNKGEGMYMPHPHVHEEWLAESKEKSKARRGQKEKSSKANATTTNASTENPNTQVNKLKLAKHLTQALTTRVGISDADAKELAESLWKDMQSKA